jgi:oligopeptide/dipeptide ABC transporter ATP-binding protein
MFVRVQLVAKNGHSDAVPTAWIPRSVIASLFRESPRPRSCSGTRTIPTPRLLDEIPQIEQRRRIFAPIKGEILTLAPPSGCHFHPQCPFAIARCHAEPRRLRQVALGRWWLVISTTGA